MSPFSYGIYKLAGFFWGPFPLGEPILIPTPVNLPFLSRPLYFHPVLGEPILLTPLDESILVLLLRRSHFLVPPTLSELILVTPSSGEPIFVPLPVSEPLLLTPHLSKPIIVPTPSK